MKIKHPSSLAGNASVVVAQVNGSDVFGASMAVT
jgi:hypothetical protein